jgi:hypothetical protein
MGDAWLSFQWNDLNVCNMHNPNHINHIQSLYLVQSFTIRLTCNYSYFPNFGLYFWSNCFWICRLDIMLQLFKLLIFLVICPCWVLHCCNWKIISDFFIILYIYLYSRLSIKLTY